jgi:hypothetical protein
LVSMFTILLTNSTMPTVRCSIPALFAKGERWLDR